MVRRDVEPAALTGGRVDLAHPSCTESLEALRDAKRRGLALTLTFLVKPGPLTLQCALELWTDEPRRVFGLRPVRLEPGDPADLVLIDP
jgi:dihydroorotase-like cyclic amidohydrolase